MTGRAPYDFMPAVPSFELRSDDVADGQMMSQNQVFDGFGMTGGHISTSLSWSGFTAQTKNFAVTLFDPDAPTGSGWWALGRARHPRVGDRTRDARPAPAVPACPKRRSTSAMTTWSRIRRCRGAGRRPAAPLLVRGTCARRGVAGRQRRDLTWHGRLQPAFPHHRACPAHPRVRLIFNSARRRGQDRSREAGQLGRQPRRMSARWRLSGEVCAG